MQNDGGDFRQDLSAELPGTYGEAATLVIGKSRFTVPNLFSQNTRILPSEATAASSMLLKRIEFLNQTRLPLHRNGVRPKTP